jgi:hypothetical protein
LVTKSNPWLLFCHIFFFLIYSGIQFSELMMRTGRIGDDFDSIQAELDMWTFGSEQFLARFGSEAGIQCGNGCFSKWNFGLLCTQELKKEKSEGGVNGECFWRNFWREREELVISRMNRGR